MLRLVASRLVEKPKPTLGIASRMNEQVVVAMAHRLLARASPLFQTMD